MGDHFFIVMLTFLACPKNTPSKMDGLFFVSFEDDAKYILIIEKKLQLEGLVKDLVGFSFRKFCGFHGIGNGYSCFRVGFERDLFYSPGKG